MRSLIVYLLAFAATYGQKSYTLAECVSLAQQHNPDVLLQNLNISRAENTLDQSLKSRIPGVSTSISSGLNGGRSIDPFSNSFVQRTISYNSLSVSTNWILFNGFSLRNQIEQNRENTFAEQVQLEVVRKEVSLAVTEAFGNVVISQALIGMQQESVQDLTEQAVSVKERIKEGVMTAYNLTETEAQLAYARFELINAKNNHHLAKKLLAQLLMWNENFEIVVPELPSSFTIPTGNSLHPALQVWDHRIRSAQYRVETARAERYPRLSLNLGLGTSYSSGAISEFTYLQQLNHNFNQFAGLGLSLPLFSNGQAVTRIKAAEIEEKIVRGQREKTAVQLTRQVETLQLELASLKEKLKSAEINLNAQTQLYEVAKEKFKEGLVNQLELNTYRLNRERAKAQFIQTQYELYFKNEMFKEFRD